MAHKTLIGGTAYSIKGGRTLIGGTGYAVKSGRTLIGGTEYNISFGTPLGNFAVGTSVYLNEAGSPVEYLIVHQGNPDAALYDASCNGTWLLRKNIYADMQWNTGYPNDWENSSLKAYLDSTFLARYDLQILATIKQVKIPYRPGYKKYDQTINSGANGLSCKVFLLSWPEVGWNYSMSKYFSSFIAIDGACLSYFYGTSQVDEKRIGYLNGVASTWWIRSPITNTDGQAVYVSKTGGDGATNSQVPDNRGVRPAIILPSDTPVPDSHLIA